MSSNQLSSSTTVSGSAPLLASPSKPDHELSLSCHSSSSDLAFQSNAALTSPALYSSLIRPALVPPVIPASNLDSTTVTISTLSPPSRPALTSPACQAELSPLRLPVADAMIRSPETPGQTTLVQQLNSPGFRAEESNASKEVAFSPRAEAEEGEIENSGSSSEVEIFLSSLGFENSMFASTVAEVERTTPLTEQNPAKPASDVTSPQMPPAPLHQTVPLPDVTLDCDAQSRTPELALPPSQPEIVLHKAGRKVETTISNTPSGMPATDSQEFAIDCINIDSHHKTPNVYINGLPPHFPEEQLYALTAPFGPIRSVRTFTRHVKESESGYGFVLFETVDAAERCIMSLRRYRNLHPTFSKQVHKIPGITYTQLRPPSPEDGSILPGTWGHESTKDAEMSFKEKMESLHDPTSTNLYMEGLPLSIDEATLSALVSPHRISSSRFFQTRLSNPPRIIAFVRLETRTGAEEVIERLHGRMVRGWNDTGSRISVRFADTAEQRELRRTERANKEGEPSPSRLTIAQAALLNMRGQELRQRQNPMMVTHQSLPDRLSRLRVDDVYPEFTQNARLSSNGLSVDYPLAPNTGCISPRIRTSVSSPYPHQLGSHQLDSGPNVDPGMLTLLDSLRSSRSFRGGDYAGPDDIEYNIGPQVSHRATHILEDFGYSTQQFPLRNGYTSTEEYIMRAHAESATQRRRPPPLDLYRRRRDSEANASISLGVRGHRTQASTITLPQKVFTPSAVMEPPQGDYQAVAAIGNELRPRAQQPELRQENNLRRNSGIHPSHGISRTAARDSVQQKPSQVSPIPAQQPLHTETYSVGHTRSSTLPHRSAPVNQHQRHYQHNSMSAASSTGHSQDAISAILNSMNRNTSITSLRTKPSNNDTPDDHATNELKDISQSKNSSRLSYDNVKGSLQSEQRKTCLVRDSLAGNEIDQASPPLTSPALTYSSQTPSTLSPATPFFGSFASQSDGFEQAVPHGTDAKRMKGIQ